MTTMTTDGFVRRQPTPTRIQPHQARPSVARRPTTSVTKTATTHTAKRRPQRFGRLRASLQLPLIIGGAMTAGVLAQSEIIGQLLVLGYGVAALIWKIPSRTTFTLVLLSMIATTALLIVRGNIPLAQAFATYTFLLLVVGVITLSRELKKEGGRIYSRRTNNI